MKIKVINPNTSEMMTEGIRLSAEKYCNTDTEIVCVNPASGPEVIDSAYDEIIAGYYLLEEVLKTEKEDDFDAYVIACFGDPALHAVREITSKPVVGIAEAAMALTGFIGGRYSLVSVTPKSRKVFEELIDRYGADKHLASIRTPDLTVKDTEDDFEKTKSLLVEEAVAAVKDDYAEVILLGCAGMVGFTEIVEEACGVPVIDSVGAGVKMAELLVGLDLTTSKIFSYDRPSKKEMKGMAEIFENIDVGK